MNKVVFITGSSSGIGKETAFCFARAGWKIVVTYHTKAEDGQRVGEECKKFGATDVLVEKLNVADDNCLQITVRNIITKFGKIDILVNNAGILAQKPLLEKIFEDIEEQIDTNLQGPIKLTQLCLPHIKEGIVNIGSRLGFVSRKNLAVYSATKFGMRGFTKGLGQEFPQLRIACVNPGLTATSMGNAGGADPAVVGGLVYKVAVGEIRVKQGGDFNVFEYLQNPIKRFIKFLMIRK